MTASPAYEPEHAFFRMVGDPWISEDQMGDPARPTEGASAGASVGATEGAAEAFIRRHQSGVWRYLRVLGCAPDLADDLTQETFLTAFDRGIEDRSPGATASYLRQTARYLYLRATHTSRRRARLLADAAERLWDRDCAADDGEAWLEALRTCLESIDGRVRRALAMFYADGASRAVVARELQMRENGVKTMLHRVRLLLRDCIRRRMS